MRHPHCILPPSECRVTARHEMQRPIIVWQPQFDGTGRPVNRDPNSYFTHYSCAVCTGAWQEIHRAGEPSRVLVTLPAR